MTEVLVGDITRLAVDVIVNAANSTLLGGGGGRWRHSSRGGAGAPQGVPAHRRMSPGDARITPGFALPARHVVHAVGPVWRGGSDGEDEMLASCYRRSFELAADVNAASIAFPAISTGAYGFPKQRAASIAVREMQAFESRFERVVACCFSEGDASFYRPLLS